MEEIQYKSESTVLWHSAFTSSIVHVTKLMFTHDWQQNQKRFTEEQQERSKTHAENLNVLGLFSLGKVQ